MRVAEALERLRALSERLPETSETTTFGDPTFRAGKSSFAFVKDNMGDPVVWFKVNTEFQQMLCQGDDYFVAPYIGRHGWTAVRLNSNIEWDEIEPLVIESYRSVALKRMLAKLDSDRPWTD